MAIFAILHFAIVTGCEVFEKIMLQHQRYFHQKQTIYAVLLQCFAQATWVFIYLFGKPSFLAPFFFEVFANNFSDVYVRGILHIKKT